jgi:hypothetical protein
MVGFRQGKERGSGARGAVGRGSVGGESNRNGRGGHWRYLRVRAVGLGLVLFIDWESDERGWMEEGERIEML